MFPMGEKSGKKSIVKIELFFARKPALDTRALMGRKEVFLYSGGYLY